MYDFVYAFGQAGRRSRDNVAETMTKALRMYWIDLVRQHRGLN